jgi:hypothetical protein
MPGRVLLMLRACSWVVKVEWRSRRMAFGDLLDSLETLQVRHAHPIPPLRALDAIARCYHLSPFRPTCLRMSLAAIGLLRASGYAARLALGIRAGDPVDAHAWVEIDGRPVGAARHRLDYRPIIRADEESSSSSPRDASSMLPIPSRTASR